MHKLVIIVFATLYLMGVSSLVVADDAMKGDMDKMRADIKAEKEAMKADMKAKKAEMKQLKKQHKEQIKAKKQEMKSKAKAHKDEVKTQGDAMKSQAQDMKAGQDMAPAVPDIPAPSAPGAR
jgi:hypothetical protein